MPKANQRAIWEKSTMKTEPPSERTAPLSKYFKKPHNHYTIGKHGYKPGGKYER